MRIFVAAALFAAAVPAAAQTVAGPVAEVTGGRVAGTAAAGVATFRGIPFAAPPVGPLRWRAPQPVAPWAGIRDATSFGHDCMQLPFPSDAAPLGTAPSEDCLTVNVWAPADAKGKKLPVLFWIYGGGFVNGGSSPDVYDGAAFARAGVVFVSFNYRLGRFGFFAHPALSAAGEGPVGNWGLMDQQAALRWTHDNIAAFGGDPGRVTIMGESAGGMSVLDMLGAPATRGLFRGAIVLSGGGRTASQQRELARDLPGAPSAETIGLNFAKSVGVEGTDASALAALRGLPADRIVAGLNLASLFAPPSPAPTWSGPFNDGVTLNGSVEAMFDRGAQAPVPVMIGATSADIGFVPAASKDDLFAIFGSEAASARALYDPAGDAPFLDLMLKIGGDRFMIEPARYVAGRVAAAGALAYHYRFSYVAEQSRAGSKGAAHASDIPFFLDTVATKYGPATTATDRAMARTINGYVVNFVKSGNPNGPRLTDWPRFNPGEVMDFASDGVARSGGDPWTRRLDLIRPRAN
ncbi:carboxylesterase family protein [Sphingopyxis sp.]|uniref:carboxylesterase/lipase family protein n=1 Tax=Sphingopyxis sp. TaxID=1908224 RepID=UPI002636DD21|nr:carboxylesterase family protein [Sphingopyxis sp.]MCW0197304.1 carboxylesterase family protein [Sphingopyxis sp.]